MASTIPEQAQGVLASSKSFVVAEDTTAVTQQGVASSKLDYLSKALPPQLGEILSELPDSQNPFATENLEAIKTLMTNGFGEDFNLGDRMNAALVATAAREADLQIDPIEYLKEIESYRFPKKSIPPEMTTTKLSQLSTPGEPGSKRAGGNYDERDLDEVKRFAPYLALSALDSFVEELDLINLEHDDPQAFTLSADDTSNILRNIFEITKEGN